MKTPILFFLIAIFSLRCYCQNEINPAVVKNNKGNLHILKIIKSYFRSDPYQNGFGNFVKHLVNDPILINKIITKRTDTNFFSFQGQYKNYSPFSFLADRTEIKLVEKEFVINDSLSLKDTLFFYQLLGYAHGKSGADAVKSELAKFDRQFGRFFSMQSTQIRNDTNISGVVQDYFIPGAEGSPLTVAWIRLDEWESAFSVTIRLKINYN